MDRSQIVIILVALGLVGSGMLYIYADTIEPLEVLPGNIGPGDLDRWVTMEGMLKEIHEVNDTARLVVMDPIAGHSTTVFSPKPLIEDPYLQPGAQVRVTGHVDMYKGEPEIRLENPEDLEVLKPAWANDLPLIVVVNKPRLFEGVTVAVNGTASDPSSSYGSIYFMLEHGKYSVKVTVGDDIPQVPWGDGDTIRVVGKVWIDNEGRTRIKVKDWNGVTVMK